MFVDKKNINLNNFSSQESIFDKYKKQFTFWVWVWFASLLLVLLLQLSVFILYGVFSKPYVTEGIYVKGSPTYTAIHSQLHGAGASASAIDGYRQGMLIWNMLYNAIFIVIFVYMLVMLVKAFINISKKKDFTTFPLALNTWTFFLGLFSIFSLFQYATENNSAVQDYVKSYLAIFIINIIFATLNIVIWIIPARQVKALITISARYANHKFMMEFQERYSQMLKSGINPFEALSAAAGAGSMADGFGMNQSDQQPLYESHQESKNKNETLKEQVSNADLEKQKYIDQLMQMPNSQLFQMAQILNISGYEDMSKQELVSLIYNYTKQAEKAYKTVQDDLNKEENK
ncbi:hypothetical protein [Mycoplasmopsis verecunda]|uniref:Transmembrane protein n=1 Tax=Mycoplasmopsis verecunda TaxID=171291 RepID=A0A1T4LR54_9BACT|nr:hypothetical protein [Mycoplasmopsis verecunda]WPB54582.1 hypothetical protein SAM46_00210 [Mycoplasmopsis verecunda]SJZ57239.1 hypothetical protein SAMN02745154_00520 [Mycoplasmopsis verecunda]